MVFASPIFLFLFLPITLLVYYFARPRNAVLLVASLVFYAWGEPIYVLLMLFSILANWLVSHWIARAKRKKGVLSLALILNLGMLALFKYADLFVGTLNAGLKLNLPLAGLALPLGISFYTFQILSYVIDVYRGDVPPARNIVSFGAYVTMFPQLIAGPIVRYADVAAQLDNRTLRLTDVAEGAQRFCVGLAKKTLLANTLSETADLAFQMGGGALSAGAAWLGAVCYALQIYYDFSGYSDMAIGLGRMLGFDFLENFNYPYISKSIREFWRRWHMSLSGWFRDYLYIPLGGNRKGGLATCRNLVIVFALCGLWHGASWSFLAWGLYHGLFLSLERIPLLRKIEKRTPRPLGMVYALFVVLVGWVIFRADTLPEAATYLKAMFGMGGGVALTALANARLYVALGAGALFCGPILPWLKAKTLLRDGKRALLPEWTGALVSIALLAVCSILLAGGTYNPFIYFRF